MKSCNSCISVSLSLHIETLGFQYTRGCPICRILHSFQNWRRLINCWCNMRINNRSVWAARRAGTDSFLQEEHSCQLFSPQISCPAFMARSPPCKMTVVSQPHLFWTSSLRWAREYVFWSKLTLTCCFLQVLPSILFYLFFDTHSTSGGHHKSKRKT